jgi:hypothetical protein
MEKVEVSNIAESSVQTTRQFDLGLWLGRHQALASVANYCSEADALALTTIREQRLYQTLGITWEAFCSRYAGMSRVTANAIIDKLEEFGAIYFRLAEILKIPVNQYRAIQSAIKDDSLEFEGELIPINREHTKKLAEAVSKLRKEHQRLMIKVHGSRILDLQMELDRVVGYIDAAAHRSPSDDRGQILSITQDYAQRAVDAAEHAYKEVRK